MKKFKSVELKRKDYFWTVFAATCVRIILMPIALFLRIYLWVWDGEISEFLSSNKEI